MPKRAVLLVNLGSPNSTSVGDVRDYLREYAIEVSSPGLDRPLRRQEHFAAAQGHRVRLRTTGKKLRGEVLAANEQSVTVAASDGAETEIPYAEIVRANLIDEGA